jgi:hypothetical protein
MTVGRSQAGGRRTQSRFQRRKDIQRLHRLGWCNRHIARRLTIHQNLVTYYLKTGPGQRRRPGDLMAIQAGRIPSVDRQPKRRAPRTVSLDARDLTPVDKMRTSR